MSSAIRQWRAWWQDTEGWTRLEGMQKAWAAIVEQQVRIVELEAALAERDKIIARLTVDCDEYELIDGRCHDAETDAICPREPGCHDRDRVRAGVDI